jgi:Zn-dependent membrane protease YugP
MLMSLGSALYFDTSYLLLVLPAFLLSLAAQLYVRSVFTRYGAMTSMHRIPAEQVARDLLDRNGCGDVRMETVPGDLTDHYDPATGCSGSHSRPADPLRWPPSG